MKEYFKGVAQQATAILLAALGAALIAFLQSVLGDLQGSGIEKMTPTDTGLLGGVLKFAHSIFQKFPGIMRV